ncbi:alkaline phosphatase family protein [Solibacillus sp. FSL H8-0538]|uniref:alkaline phosphatase family protein n=1 Tax=Solibacillus sp. FSL H8-0538 TaxID=2921400 RepID=UPI0030F90EB3
MTLLKRTILTVFILFIVVCVGLVLGISMSQTKELEDIAVEPPKKPIILITVDSLMAEPLQKAIGEGKAPAFSFLINNGQLYTDVVSSYPTMSVTIDSTILTGVYPNEHKVPGLIWFHENENRVISYGSGVSEIWNLGVKNVALDSVVQLNKEHLSQNIKTIHEELAIRNLQSASINGLIYRGSHPHKLHVPKLISIANLLPKEIEMNGPTLLSLGTLSQYNPENDRNKFIWDRLGGNNNFTVNELSYLIEQNKLPSFTLAYLPDADATIHKNGPTDLKGIEKADKALQELLNSYSSWEEAVQEVTWIVLGDSGQSFINKDKETSLINLNELLPNYTFWERENEDGQLAIAINERMAYIYVKYNQVKLSELVTILKEDERIGFIAWKDEQTNHVVSTQSDEELTFSPNGSYVDIYNQSWQLDGDLSLLDLKINEQGVIHYNNYPDALARLNGALHSQEGNVIIVDAKPSYEFIEKHSHDHAGGGAHGSLHKVDSVVPLIIVGTNKSPQSNRLVDLKEWILQLLGDS